MAAVDTAGDGSVVVVAGLPEELQEASPSATIAEAHKHSGAAAAAAARAGHALGRPEGALPNGSLGGSRGRGDRLVAWSARAKSMGADLAAAWVLRSPGGAERVEAPPLAAGSPVRCAR